MLVIPAQVSDLCLCAVDRRTTHGRFRPPRLESQWGGEAREAGEGDVPRRECRLAGVVQGMEEWVWFQDRVREGVQEGRWSGDPKM